MKILHTVEFYYPSVGGAQIVVKQLSERMAAQGHEVWVATTKLSERKKKIINQVHIAEFDISGNKVRGFQGDVDAYKQFLLKNDFDVIMNYAAQQWTSDLFFDVMDQVKAKKVFVPCGFSGLFNPAYKEYFEVMPTILKKYNATVYLSNDYRDINFARTHKVSNINLIPNAVDEHEFDSVDTSDFEKIRQQLAIPSDHQLLVTIGSHTGSKGHKECFEVLRRVKQKKITLVVVGNMKKGCFKACSRSEQITNTISMFSGKKTYVVDLSRVDTIRLLKAADLFLFLSNIECSPLVLFESGAAGIPFVSTDVGNSKEIAQWTGGGVITATRFLTDGKSVANIIETAKIVSNLLKDTSKRSQLGACARSKVLNNYTWKVIAQHYLDLYNSL